MLLAPFLWIFCEFDEKVLDNLSLVFPTSILQSKNGLCIYEDTACWYYEASQPALQF